MTFTRRILKGENTYVYKVRTYRERETGKVKQDTEYLGKEIIQDGKTRIIPPKRKMKGLREILDHGQPIALFKLAEEFGLPEIIQTELDLYTKIEDIGIKVTILAINNITSNMTIRSIGHWYSRSALKECLEILPDDLTPKKVRNILELLAKRNPDIHGLIEEGIAERINKLHKKDLQMVVYDLTALIYYGEKNDLAQYGHAYRTTKEKQINMVLGVTMEHKLPIHHKVLPGKIVSVSTIHSFLKELDVFGVKKAILVLDRGFYSKRNMKEILKAKHGVIGALSSHLKLTKQSLTKSIDIENSRFRILYPDQVIFAKEFVEDNIRVIVYHDPERKSRQLRCFYENLNEVENRLKDLEKKVFDNKNDLQEELEGVCGNYLNYFFIKQIYSDHWTFTYKLKHKSIQRYTNRFGKTVLFTSTKLDPVEVLKTYREKDVIEKVFQLMKKHGLKRTNSNLETSTKARILLSYLGYLLLSLLRMNLDDEISLEKALTSLGEIREVVYKDGSRELPELTKLQKSVLEKLNML